MPIVVAPLAAIIVALVALILIYAFYQLFHPLLQGLGNEGGTVGGLIARVADRILTSAYQYALAWAKSALHTILGFILAPVFWVERHISMLTQGLNFLTFALSWTDNIFIPNQISAALGVVRGWITQSEQYAAGLVSSLASWTRGQLASLTTYVQSGLAADARYSLALFDTAQKYTAAGLAAESSYVQNALGQLESFTAAGLAQDAAYAEHLFGQSISYTQSLVGSAVGAIDTDLGNITSWVTGQYGTLSLAISLAQARSFALTQSLVGTVEADLGKLKTECTDNLCSGLGDLASLFNALTGDLGLAALFALAGEFAHDPRGAAADVESTLGTVARDAAGAVRTLIGL